MDGTKPSTSYEGFDSVPPDAKNLVKRLFDAVDIVQKPLQKMAELDVIYQAVMREVERIQDTLNEGLMEMSREQVDEMFDTLENELRMAQHLAFWKSGVMFDVDTKLQNLIGCQTDPQQIKQPVVEEGEAQKVATRKRRGRKQAAKPKGFRSKRQAPTARENIRRIERDTRSQSVVKGKAKESPSPPAVSDQYLSGRRKKIKVQELNEGRSMQKKRGAGRPRLPRKPRQATSAVTEITEGENNLDPLYCLCRQVSYGDMILCENKKCNEWYHFPCVQLRQKPKGKWYCPHCRGDRCDVINPDLIE
ncbi:PHD-finger family protein [Brugia malayi]|uniref:Bm10711, isoform b n=1 Tax=Brugia malayi TaxID=6279 RepID=A0A0J9Y0N4_BRUMA|nr:PHD-finger family protein [Brugia malayi]CDP99269.1 Bm10711, isoform b [Brugia malayi]VIO91126.1 PHD-finger family protein [Brugia malayi]